MIRRRSAADRAIEVACATDSAFLPHCATMLRSVLDHCDGPARIHLLHDEGVTAGQLERIRDMVVDGGGRLVPHPIDRAGLRGAERFAPAPTWYRLLLPELLPDTDRVLYLDCDTVVTDSLRPLWSTDLSRHSVAAVSAVFPWPEWGERHCVALGIEDPRHYFVAGLMLMNLRRLREEGLPGTALDFALERGDRDSFMALPDGDDEAFREYVAAHPERMIFADQDAVNALLAKSRLVLHPRWNCTNQLIESPFSVAVFGGREREEAIRDPAVRHFEGGTRPKPWMPGADAEDRELYWSHRNRTPWAQRVYFRERSRWPRWSSSRSAAQSVFSPYTVEAPKPTDEASSK